MRLGALRGKKCVRANITADAFGQTLGGALAAQTTPAKTLANFGDETSNLRLRSPNEFKSFDFNLAQAGRFDLSYRNAAPEALTFAEYTALRSAANVATADARIDSTLENQFISSTRNANQAASVSPSVSGESDTNLGGYTTGGKFIKFVRSDLNYDDRVFATRIPVDVGVSSDYGQVTAAFDGNRQGGLIIPQPNGKFDFTASPANNRFTYESLLANTTDPVARFRLTEVGCGQYGQNCREYVELGAVLDKDNPKYQEALYKYNSINRFALGTATGVAGVFTGGLAYEYAIGFGALRAGALAGGVGDLTIQLGNLGANKVSDGQIGQDRFNFGELALSTGGGLILSGAGKYAPQFRDYISNIVSDIGVASNVRLNPFAQELSLGAPVNIYDAIIGGQQVGVSNSLKQLLPGGSDFVGPLTELDAKVLFGARRPGSNNFVGGHSPDVLSSPNYQYNPNVTLNPDETISVIDFKGTIVRKDGTIGLSKAKSPNIQTIAPRSFDNADILQAGLQTANAPGVVLRTNGNITTTIHTSSYRGVEWQVVKENGVITSSFPTGGRRVK